MPAAINLALIRRPMAAIPVLSYLAAGGLRQRCKVYISGKTRWHAQLRVHATDEARSCFIPMPYIIPVFRTIFNGGLVFDFFLQNGGAL